jgi:hypothetical protein
VRGGDHLRDRPRHGLVALVEQVRDELRVAVDAEHELRQVVAADREAVEHLRELLGQVTLLGISHIT